MSNSSYFKRPTGRDHHRVHLSVLLGSRRQERLYSKFPSRDSEGLALIEEKHAQSREAEVPGVYMGEWWVIKPKGSLGTNDKQHLSHTEALGTPCFPLHAPSSDFSHMPARPFTSPLTCLLSIPTWSSAESSRSTVLILIWA